MWSLAKYQPGEIMNLAVKIEKTGAEFYRKLAAKAPNQESKDLLLYLSAEEGEHQAKFVELGRGMDSADAPESYPGEYDEYLAVMIENHLFSNTDELEKMVHKATSGRDIIKLAMDFERDTILFFNGFRNIVVNEQKAVIDDLIMEEQTHLVKLARIKKSFAE